jgi:hypothetical protein
MSECTKVLVLGTGLSASGKAIRLRQRGAGDFVILAPTQKYGILPHAHGNANAVRSGAPQGTSKWVVSVASRHMGSALGHGPGHKASPLAPAGAGPCALGPIT